ncbi:hypothetical protein PoB_001587100 [Plakobranchus ocellatus]|uniref:Uncharacterized protein n=1 Tax=Plakobranchus ocellatus TaxID=259542 RepID=A0AAV3Z464_9GAST|nr:hypothetical protein PoB_001587100 [Plakobranchus ocellatus]
MHSCTNASPRNQFRPGHWPPGAGCTQQHGDALTHACCLPSAVALPPSLPAALDMGGHAVTANVCVCDCRGHYPILPNGSRPRPSFGAARPCTSAVSTHCDDSVINFVWLKLCCSTILPTKHASLPAVSLLQLLLGNLPYQTRLLACSVVTTAAAAAASAAAAAAARPSSLPNTPPCL